MKNKWIVYYEKVKEIVKVVDPELVSRINRQKTILVKSKKSERMVYRTVGAEEAERLQKINRGENCQVHLYC